MTNDEAIGECSSDEMRFGLCHSFVIRHLDFVIFPFALTAAASSDCINGVKWFALLLFVAGQCSCTTLVTRRDLYSPEPAPDSREVRQRWTSTSTTTTTTTQMRTNPSELDEGPPLPPPQFR